ncbi:Sodium/hydrogen exchanger [Phellopilus nigrolimitatus]|nr:Sodium/hydrogen exchanger [Phellopilus nigrolimitatus]
MISLLAKEKLYIGEVVLGTGFGVIIGPYCAGIFDPRSWGSTTEEQNKITLEIMRVVLATGLFAIGVELPKAYLAEHARSLLVMVVPTMAFGWLVSAGIIHALFPALTFVSSLAISACLTPTDPILAAAIIGGKFAIKNVPGHVRRILSAESAANDGLAYPFLSISIYLAVESSKKVAFGKWFLIGWLCMDCLAFSFLMKISHRKGLIDRESFVAQYLALAIFTIGVASTIGTDDLLATFAAGSAISWDGHFNKHTEDEVFSSVLDLFDKFQALEPWRLIVLFLAILVLRRIPSLLALYKFIPDVHNWRPMGVGAIFISTLALTELPVPNDPPANQNELLAASLHPIVSFVVLCSIVIRESFPFLIRSLPSSLLHTDFVLR